jgi:membrane-associated phospholipid phosphatase
MSFSIFAQVDSIRPVQADTSSSPDTIRPATDTMSIKTTKPPESAVKQPTRRSVYSINAGVDVPITAIGAGWSIFAFTKIYSKGSSDSMDIISLHESDVPGFDRWAIQPYDEGLDKFSYYPFYAAIPLPLIYSLSDNSIRKDFFKVSFLYLEAMSITGLFGTGGTYFVDRYRPYAYTAETPMEKRVGENAKNSFYAGHVEIIAVSTFFIAKVHNDYHPGSESNWMYFAAASGATLGMSYLRLAAGMHFPSDIILGMTTGILAGVLVPQFHKNKEKKNSLSVLPYKTENRTGLSFSYRW